MKNKKQDFSFKDKIIDTVSFKKRNEINRIILTLTKGDMVKIVYYDHKQCISKEGIITKIDEDFKTLTVVGVEIPVAHIINIVITNQI